ncbi:UTP--glucose-1-phosphate uridylyltransferase GalU [Sutcliffiella horikoshii]|uniref:UTP--glucose-1-phosphate uridylyltransferase GalU n=1 Tax=Sutcliffiella horikoshii TaxID=79883 RepID=UPI00384E2702
MKIKKAIIPAAGLGTRFLPATKAQPKEMLPIVDKPTIQYIVEEAALSGIEDIIIITGRGKRAIEDHFDKSYELEQTLKTKEKWDYLKSIESISGLANIHYIRQKEPKGLGDAIYCAKSFIGTEPFAVLLGDDIIVSDKEPCLSQMINVHEKYETSVIGVKEVSDDEVPSLGIIGYEEEVEEDRIFKVSKLVEKPKIEDAPSRLAIMGRYILTPEIFDILKSQKPGSGGEIQLTDALEELNKRQSLIGYKFDGERYDVGNKFGFIKAQIDFSLKRDDLKIQVKDYLSTLISKIY